MYSVECKVESLGRLCGRCVGTLMYSVECKVESLGGLCGRCVGTHNYASNGI